MSYEHLVRGGALQFPDGRDPNHTCKGLRTVRVAYSCRATDDPPWATPNSRTTTIRCDWIGVWYYADR